MGLIDLIRGKPDFSEPADEVVDFDCIPADEKICADGHFIVPYNTLMRKVQEVDGVHYVGTYTVTRDCVGNELNRSEVEWMRPL